ncbi:5309_t:CDS:1 [Racocetra persica]|uniref:5309_t:CDS:1 n=1 Tax=Racocetra persica TaxID=160502 RepID=A0ACA9M432_9GLOM|nr:5309_t:CDS:1 [Racocetra persica]
MTNLLVKLSLFFLVITIPFYVSAYPTGAGTCNVDEMATKGHGPSKIQGFGGYSISTSKQGQSLNIKISGPSSSTSVKGVLIYTIDSNGKDTGSFTIPTGYKNCQGQNTLTHTNANSKSLPLTYTWTPSGTSGNVTVRGIVVQDFSNWVKLQEINFDSSSGTFSSSNNTNFQSGSGSDSGVGSWFKNYLLFIILMIITVILYIVGSVTETMLKNQRSKAKIYRNN